MYFIKKFFIGDDKRGGTRNLEEARKWISEGKEIHLIFSDKKSSWATKATIKDIVEADGKIIVTTDKNDVIDLEGFDDNAREIEVLCFSADDGSSYDIVEARRLVKEGVNLRAEGIYVKTSYVAAFLEDDLFETISGSLYRVIS